MYFFLFATELSVRVLDLNCFLSSMQERKKEEKDGTTRLHSMVVVEAAVVTFFPIH